MADKPDPVTRAANHASHGVPRQIRARTGETNDPLPEGFHQEGPNHHFHVTPADHDGQRAKPKTPQELGVSEQQVALPSSLTGDAAAQELAHQNAVHAMQVQEQHAQHEERLHQRQHEMPVHVNKATRAGETTAANKQMDSREGPRPAKWGNHHRQ